MKILITNDDGIGAPGLLALTEWASGLGEVTVAAPTFQQSGKSHAIDFVTPMVVTEVPVAHAVRGFSVASTPADCIRFALLGLGETYDLVLSGINSGWNIGHDIVYSGTVGAVMEAAHHGLPALALSAAQDGLAGAKTHLDEVWRFVTERHLLEEHLLYNINIPADAARIALTRQGEGYYIDDFFRMADGTYTQKGRYVPDPDPDDERMDTVAVKRGIISVTPLALGVTDETVYSRLCL